MSFSNYIKGLDVSINSFFDKYGIDATWKSTTQDIDAQTGSPINTYTDSSIKIIPGCPTKQMEKDEVSKLGDVSLTIGVKVNVQPDDLIVIESETYFVTNINQMIYPNSTLTLKCITIQKKISDA